MTPDPSPKRPRMSLTLMDDDSNKENIPPLRFDPINVPDVTRSPTSLRRSATDANVGTPSRHSPRRHASTSDVTSTPRTPATALSRLAISTPPASPPHVLLPIYARVRAFLRPVCNGLSSLAGRHQERVAIESFIRSFLTDDATSVSSALYISGTPGTGKTALVNAVLSDLQEDLKSASTEVITINCMSLRNLDALWERVASATVNNATSKRKIAGKVKAFSHKDLAGIFTLRENRCVLLLDELDHIASSPSDLEALFKSVHECSSSIRLIGIANTHTLSSASTSISSLQSLVGLTTLHFAPYTPEQLLAILNLRLASLSADAGDELKKFLPAPTLNLLTRKVGAQTGDVRAVLEVLRGAIDIAVNASASTNPLERPDASVSPAHILDALKAYAPMKKVSPQSAGPSKASDSELVVKVRSLGRQQRMVLLAMTLACRRVERGLPVSPSVSSSRTPLKRTPSSSQVLKSNSSVDQTQLYQYYTTILSHEDVNPVSRTEFRDVMGILETIGLVSLGSGKASNGKGGKRSLARTSSFNSAKGLGEDVRFNEGVRLDEVARGLGISDLSGTQTQTCEIVEEEVQIIWNKESAKIHSESQTLNASTGAHHHAFAEAMED
ncbi:P-loop containing nucleoside triphosphate hydrolase protein [Abortiporus biennis]|nr:P-loop containing nucleoside triphosphate hydrolase protein [Abortiporus biennis]